MGNITLKEKMKYLTFKYNTLNNFLSSLRVRAVRAALSVTQTSQIYKYFLEK